MTNPVCERAWMKRLLSSISSGENKCWKTKSHGEISLSKKSDLWYGFFLGFASETFKQPSQVFAKSRGEYYMAPFNICNLSRHFHFLSWKCGHLPIAFFIYCYYYWSCFALNDLSNFSERESAVWLVSSI